MKNINLGSLNPNIRVLLTPIVIILSVVVIGFILVQEGYSRIKDQIATYEAAQKTERSLKTKFDTLNQFPKSQLTDERKVLLALPDKSPVIPLIASIRNLAAQHGVTLDRMFLATASSTEIFDTAIFTLTIQVKDIPNLLVFLRAVYGSTPITTVQSIKLDQSALGENLEADLSLSFYWSGLPTFIPSVSSPIGVLTDEERIILTQIQTLSTPTFSTLTPQGPKERLEPFN